MKAALTFDDGPSSQWTEPLLDLLADHDAQATFFVLGVHLAGREQTLMRMHFDGHEIAVHGWTHTRVTELDEATLRADLLRTAAGIGDFTGTVPKLWRAPHLDVNPQALAVASSVGLRHVGATVDPGDWARDSAEGICDHVQRNLRPHDVILLHDGIPPGGGTGTNSRQPTVDAVGLLLNREPLVDWVTVSDLR